MNIYTCFHNACGEKWKRICMRIPIYKPDVLFRYPTAIYMRTNIVVSFLAFFCFINASRAFGQNITISVKKQPLESVFKMIEKQSGYLFWCEKELLQKSRPVDVTINNATLAQTLDACLKGQALTYAIKGKTIVIKAKERTPERNPGNLKAVIVTGQVMNEAGGFLPNVSIRQKGSDKIAVTDNDGRFQIEVTDINVPLQFAYVGYEPLEVHAKNTHHVILVVSVSKLDEVQVIAYGTTTRRLNTGSVSTLKAEDIEKQPVSNPLAAIQGRLPGIVITQSSGLPGSSFKVEVRGRTAIDRGISDDQPLIVIDGIPYGPNNGYLNLQVSSIGNPSNGSGVTAPGGISPLNSINPQDIETIDILKDADATAIYGSRGANGVVLISTKKGKVGKTRINFNASTGISQVTKQVQMMNTQQYVNMRKIAYLNDGTAPTASNGYDIIKWDTARYTDFTSLFTNKDAKATDVQLSVSGGNTNTQFLLGGSYNRQSSVLPGDQYYQRGTVHFNVGHISTNGKFKLNVSSLFNGDVNNTINSDLSSFYFLAPNLIVYDNNGNLAWNEGGVTYTNPLSYLEKTYQAKNKGFAGSIAMSYFIISGFNLKVNTGYNASLLKEVSLTPITSLNPITIPKTGSSIISDNQFLSWVIEPQLEYTKRFGYGNFTILTGATLQATDQNGQTLNGSGYTSDNLLYSLGSAPTLTATSAGEQYRYQAIFARLTYNHSDRYLLNLSARRDGSSRFAPENRFANFASVGAGWIFSNEKSIKDNLQFLSFGKIRASYGTTGNDKIANYQFLDTWASYPTPYNGTTALYPNKLYNPDYHWEKTNKFEGAIELGFLKDNILFSAAYYNNRSSNQLVQYPLPTLTGFTNVIDNLPALVENEGWELTLNTNNVSTALFKWNTSLNFTIPNNTLISYPGLANSSYASTYVVGKSLNVINKYRFLGLNDQTGLYQFEDVDGNGTFNTKDRQPLGSIDPKFYGGIQNTFSYKGFQLDFFFSFTKQTGKNYLSVLRSLPGSMNNLPAIMTDFWTKPGDHAQFQKLSAASSTVFAGWLNLQNSDGSYSDASYIRLKNVSLSYTLPKRWLSAAHFSNARIYMQGQNLLTITGFALIDPEVQNLNRTATMRTITAGIQFEL